MSSQSEYARKADSPWRGRSIRVKTGTSTQNTRQQRKALAAMSQCELITGKTEAELDAFHAEQRTRVFARYGIEMAS